MIVTAPLRLDLCGGVTDIPQFAAEVGTTVTNIGVRVYEPHAPHAERAVAVEVSTSDAPQLTVNGSPVPLEVPDHRYELFRATAAHVLLRQSSTEPLKLALSNTLPSGTGLGSSAVATSCIFGAVEAYQNGGQIPDAHQLIVRAHNFETEQLQISGGFQDYIGAVYGNVNRIESRSLAELDTACLGVQPSPDFVELIEGSLVLAIAMSGNRSSSDIVDDEVARLQRNPASYHERLAEMHEHNRTLGDLACGEVTLDAALVGDIMQKSWEIQQTLSPLVGQRLKDLERVVAPYALGVHGPGAGANSLAVLAKPGAKAALVDALAHSPDILVLCPKLSPGIQVRP